MDAAPAAPGGQQYLTFMLGSEVYAIGILGIKEIIEYGELTTVPCLPAFIRGVINLRGAVVPVVDLAARFGRQAGAPTRRTCVVIVEARADDATHDIGIMVDAVNAVLDIPPAQIAPPPAFGAAIRADFIAGMGKVRDRFVILLDSDRVLAVDELAQLADVA
ncbi:chemotaxis protein CheW [Duganella sp.]|uniref:chemotaxis protein CheW n=1 Tax=Duganella sp. TaxID=1904440 RepID=UPI0031D5F816